MRSMCMCFDNITIYVDFIDKTDGKDPKKRERYRMRTLKTMEPYGLNIADSV